MVDKITLQNLSTNAVLIIDKFDSQYVLDTVDWDSPAITFESYRVPYQIGETIAGTPIVGLRNPTITGYVVASNVRKRTTWEQYLIDQQTAIDAYKEVLDRTISVYQDILIEANGFYIKARPTTPVKYSTDETQNNEVLCYFSIELACYTPLFYKDSKQAVLATTAGAFHFPLVLLESGITMGTIMRRQSVSISNEGDTPVGCIIKIAADGGSVVDPRFYNVNTGEYIGFQDVTLDDGDYITITTNVGEENAILHDVSEATNVSVIGNLVAGSEFIKIQQGENYYSYEVDETYANNIQVFVDFTEQYFNIDAM